MIELDLIKNEYLKYINGTFDDKTEYFQKIRIADIEYVLSEIQSIEDDFGVNIYNADLEILSCFWNVISQGKRQPRIELISSIINKYIQWAVDNGKSNKRYNQFLLLNKNDPTNTVKSLFVKDIDDLKNFISIGNPESASDIITVASYDKIILQLVYHGFEYREAMVIPYNAIDFTKKTITAFEKNILLNDDLFDDIVKYIKSPYVCVVREHMISKRKKRNPEGCKELMLQTNGTKLNHRLGIVRMKTYNDRYCEMTGLFRRIWIKNVYLSGLFYRRVYDSTISLLDNQKADFENFRKVWYDNV